MNNIPKEFYYLQSDERQEYSAMPSGGEIDSDKLRQKDPNFWVSRTLHEESKPKHLIIHDFFSAHRTDYQNRELRKKLAELIRQGFPLFLWKDNQFITLNHNNLNDIFTESAPTFPDTIINHGVKTHRFTKDSMMILDDCWISQILADQKQLQPRALYTSLWNKLDDSHKKTALNILASSKPKLSLWIQNVFPEKPISDTMNLPIISQYQQIKIKDDVLEGTIKNQSIAESIEVLLESASDAAIKALIPFSSKIKYLSIHELNVSQFKKLIAAIPHIETLDLSHCKTFGTESLGLKAKSLPLLSWLDLSSSSITPLQLQELLGAAPNLEVLQLPWCDQLHVSSLQLEAKSLPSLYWLDLSWSSITGLQLKELMKAACDVDTVELYQCKKLGIEPFGLIAESLKSLSTINLKDSYLTSLQLKELLEAAPHLQTLNLSNCETYKGDLGTAVLALKAKSLLLLKSLNLSSSFINTLQFKDLLTAAPNVEQLELLRCKNITTSPILEAGSLPWLNSLNICDGSITTLHGLLEGASQLKTLIFSSCTLDKTVVLALKAGSLPSLRSLDLKRSTLTTLQFKNLLLATSNLENLNLSENMALDATSSTLVLEAGSLPQLTSLSLENSSINAQQLTELLKATIRLETLNLNRAKCLGTSLLKLNRGSLPLLKTLTLNEKSTTILQFKELLHAADHLEELILNGSYNVKEKIGADSLGLESGGLPLLKSLNLNQSNLIAPQLNELLTAASKLQILQLTKCRNIGTDSLELKAKSLPWLKSADLSSSLLTASQLKVFLHAAPNLETLNLSGLNTVGSSSFSIDAKSLSLLRLLNLHSSATAVELKALLEAAPKLETLSLYDCNRLGTASLTLQPGSLLSLKSIEATSNPIAAIQLKGLLDAAPHLEKLILCEVIDTASLTFKEKSLLSLKSLSLSNSPLSTRQLKDLLNAAPNLEILNLNNCPLDTASLELKPESLASLKELHLSSSSISIPQLKALLDAAPNLEKLICIKCHNLGTASFTLNAKSLRSLIELYFDDTHITTQQLKELLSTTPHLEKLDLSYCKKVRLSSLKFPAGSLPSLKAIHAYEQYLTPEQLDELQRAAPNAELNTSKDEEDLDALEIPNSSEEQSTQQNNKEITIETNEPQEPIHTPQEYLTHTAKKAQHFHYPTAPSSHNQEMIIAKFSQYLMTIDPWQYKSLVFSMQEGICNPLSHFFIENPKHFQEFFKRIIDWMPLTNPQPPKALQDDFEQLLDNVEKANQSINYLGSQWEPLIKTSKKPFVLYNPWHAIGLKPPIPPISTWTVYDPNYVNGPKEVAERELKQTIINSLGNTNLSVESGGMRPNPPIILNLNLFLAEGGLLSLCQVNNWQVPVSLCLQNKFSPEALSQGLLIRNTNGIPAWLRGRNHPSLKIRTLTQKLLEQYASLFPDFKAFESALEQSLNHLNSAQLKAPSGLSLEFNSLYPMETALSALVLRTAKKKALEEYSSHYFQAQKDPQTQDHSLTQYYQRLLNSPGHTLVSCSSDEDSRSLQFHLHQKSAVLGHPTYLINSPEDLLCGSDFIDAQGILQKGPGGPLYEFLKKYKDQTPTLIINYDTFKSSDFALFNTILDAEPSIDGVFFHQLFDHRIPNSLVQGKTQLRIIGIRNSANPNCYNESDFISRIPHQYKAPEKVPQLPQLMSSTSISADDAIIDLFKSPDWETQLLGQWVPEGEKFHFKEGDLERLLKTNPKRLVLRNGLDTNPLYQAFWQKALTLGVIIHQGRTIYLPKNLQIVTQQGYEWSALKPKSLTCYRGYGASQVINPTRFNELFKRYRCVNEQLQEWEGLIDTAQKTVDKRLNLYISRSLSKDQWAKLLTKAASIHLTLYLAEDVVLPQELDLKPQQMPQTKPSGPKDQIDPERTSEEAQKQIQLLNEAKKPVVINVSERQASDLITRLTMKDAASVTLAFQEHESALIKALADDETVILKGHIRPTVMDELQALIHQRRNDITAKGRIILMPTTIIPQSDLSSFKTLSNTPPEHFSAQEFTQGRIDACNEVLKISPYVFLSGLSGVGKTSFVENEFCGPQKHTLHPSIESWLKAQESGPDGEYHILFIDEATLKKRDFSEFDDLFNTPPTFLFQGTLHRLSPKHKVIFAGNPLSYGEGRVLASLFKEHGHAVVFNPLPQSVIEERILSPVFERSSLAKPDIALIQAHFFKVYHRLCSYSKERILISPRELQMMALLTQSYCTLNPGSNPKDVALHCAYQIAAPLVPLAYQKEFECFKPETQLSLIKPILQKPNASFCLTESREPIAQTLNQLMLLREQRRKSKSTANAAQLYGGLGGLLLEGAPGVGKSELLIHLLRDWGLEEVPCWSKPQQSKNAFYRIPAHYSIKQKKAALKRAFHEGAVVIMDEMNSSTMMEEFLNHLLMGKDDEGQRPKNPGFILFGTQNPASFSARRQASEALSRRLHTIQVPEYATQELIQILKTKGVDQEDARLIIQLWKKTYNEAQATHQKLPTFRDLTHMAKHWLQCKEQEKRVQEKKQQVLDAISQLRIFKQDALLQQYLDKLIKEEGHIPEQQFKTILQLAQLQETVHTLCQTLLAKDNNTSWWYELLFTNATQKATNISDSFRQIPVQDRLKLLDYSTESFDEDALPHLETFITHLEQKRFVFGIQASHSACFFKQRTDKIRGLEMDIAASESLIL